MKKIKMLAKIIIGLTLVQGIRVIETECVLLCGKLEEDILNGRFLKVLLPKNREAEFDMEALTIPGVGGIIEKRFNNMDYILIQERVKEDAPMEKGLIEIPAGKIREYENIFDCLRREIKEETGLDVIEIEGENESFICEVNGYKVLNYSPFNCSQNIDGYYPIMVQIFICKADGELLHKTDETKNIRWISLQELYSLLNKNKDSFYPMHIYTLRKYLVLRGFSDCF